MSMDKMDVVIVGGGLAGLAAAYRLADAGRQVILLERGDAPGSKNVTGGRMYVAPVRKYLPDIIDEAPFERHVVKEMLTVMDDERSTQIEHENDKWRREPFMSYTVLRAKFDNWFSEKAAEKGAFIIPKRRVDDLLWENGRVAGVKAGGEEIPARVVIAADGVLSFMAEKANLRKPLFPNNYAVAIKEVYKLEEKAIEDRFGLESGEGAAALFMGSVTKGMLGGGFLYTNKESLSVGMVLGIQDLVKAGGMIEAPKLLEGFTARPEIKRWVKGGELKEYSAHVISEGGIGAVPKLFTDGMMIAGDAAGFALNLGVTVRGMEFALVSGAIAAEVADAALKAGDTSAKALSAYETRLKETFVLRDLETFRHSREVLENRRLFSVYPRVACDLMETLFTIDDQPKGSLYRNTMSLMKRDVLGWEGFRDFLSLRRM